MVFLCRIGKEHIRTEIGVHEAKTHLSNLLKRVENGESFSISKEGKVVAVALPANNVAPKKEATEHIRV